MLKVKILKEAKLNDIVDLEGLATKNPDMAKTIFKLFFQQIFLPFAKEQLKTRKPEFTKLVVSAGEAAKTESSMETVDLESYRYFFEVAQDMPRTEKNMFGICLQYLAKNYDYSWVEDHFYLFNLRALRYIFEDHDIKMPEMPQLKKIENYSENEILMRNAEKLNKDGFNFSIGNLLEVEVLTKYKLGRRLGNGAFGTVFELLGMGMPKAIKLFTEGVDLQNDLKRMNQILRDVYSGKSSLQDLSFFDEGTIRDRDGETYYFSVMPLVIPLSTTQKFQEWQEAYKEMSLKRAVRPYIIEEFRDNLGLLRQEFRDDKLPDRYVLEDWAMEHDLDINLGGFWKILDKIEEVKMPDDEVVRYLNAMLRATKVWKGTDLHSGNIGYLPQKPDIYFFYDM